MNFTLVLTHDVDAVYAPGIIKSFFHLFWDRDIRYWKLLIKRQCSTSPFDTFDGILEIEKRYNATSTFFFLKSNSDYCFFDSFIKKQIKLIKEFGFEIALHGSLFSYNNPYILNKEKKELEEVLSEEVLGIRNHELKLDKIPTLTFEIQKSVGFLYDSTYVPQSFGSQRIYEPYEIVDGLLEIPITILDRNYQYLSNFRDVDYVWKRIEMVLDDYRDKEGVCCISWHPHAFYDKTNLAHQLFYSHFCGFSELYEKILDYGEVHGASMVSCHDFLREK